MKNKIHAEFIEMLKKVEQWVGEDSKDEAFQMNFDLFQWTE